MRIQTEIKTVTLKPRIPLKLLEVASASHILTADYIKVCKWSVGITLVYERVKFCQFLLILGTLKLWDQYCTIHIFSIMVCCYFPINVWLLNILFCSKIE